MTSATCCHTKITESIRGNTVNADDGTRLLWWQVDSNEVVEIAELNAQKELLVRSVPDLQLKAGVDQPCTATSP